MQISIQDRFDAASQSMGLAGQPYIILIWSGWAATAQISTVLVDAELCRGGEGNSPPNHYPGQWH